MRVYCNQKSPQLFEELLKTAVKYRRCSYTIRSSFVGKEKKGDGQLDLYYTSLYCRDDLDEWRKGNVGSKSFADDYDRLISTVDYYVPYHDHSH